MNRLQLVRTTGVLFILFSTLINVPYLLLIQNFEYDDILRKPTEYVLTKFHNGGTGLILTWFVFALVALLFIPASAMLEKWIEINKMRILECLLEQIITHPYLRRLCPRCQEYLLENLISFFYLIYLISYCRNYTDSCVFA